jgi:hypothetical protein
MAKSFVKRHGDQKVENYGVKVANLLQIVIYNPLAWPVTMTVRLPMMDRNQTVYDPQGN